MSRRSAGFTLLEMMVSLALVMVALLLAADLLMEAQTGFVIAAREARAEEPRFLAAALRRDMVNAKGVVEPTMLGVWTPSTLTLALGSGGWARYARTGESVERIRFDAEGDELGRRQLLRAVSDWRWREPVPGLFEIDLRYRDARVPRWGLRTGARELQPGQVPKSVSLTLALRGLGGGW